VSVKGLLFIDANQYLDLYRLAQSKDLLPALNEQRDHILVTEQIVDEVQRRKVDAASVGRKQQFQGLSRSKNAKDAKKAEEAFHEQSHELLLRVSQSRDEVTSGLAELFAQAVAPNGGELDRARKRKERGNPPGKQNGPLGDQVSFEQLLSQCKDKPQLWIISKDSDYGTVHEHKMFLNAALYEELARLYKSEPEVFCFDNLAEGLRHFAETTGAKAEKLPTLAKTEQIKKEQESLPPIGWLTNFDDSYPLAMRFQDALRMSDSLAPPSLGQVISTDEVIPSPAPKEADKDGA
jgi:PIN domain